MTALHPDEDHDLVCTSQSDHVLVVAPPGTGKTCLSVRLAGTIAPLLDTFQRVLLVTFSNQARVQLEYEAARQLEPSPRRQVEVTNYHRLFWRGVRAYRRALGLPPGTHIGSSVRRITALKAADANAVSALRGEDGPLDSLAEHRFERFQDERTPDDEVLHRLLIAVEREQQAGRLVFDDLGALFWQLLEMFPTVEAAYQARYPVVIADEHQDASELQDAVVRRLASQRLVILADPMQLIYGFRGSRPERLDRHVRQCGERFELKTPHRWRHDEHAGQWLLAVRARLRGEIYSTPAPRALEIIRTRAAYGLNAMKPKVKDAIEKAFLGGAATVAVLSTWNSEVVKLRAYLSSQGLQPRQVGGAGDFEEAREDIEQLQRDTDPQTVALRALERVNQLVPTLSRNVVAQVKRRLLVDRVNLKGSGAEASGLLRALEPLYEHGASQYVKCVVSALDACEGRGHHLPRVEAVRPLRATAEAVANDGLELEAVLDLYAENTVTSAQAAPRLGRGLYVMTAHQAKGKEFDAVVIVHASGEHFPDTDEGRRLFYVAVTRASKAWVVIAPDAGESPLLQHLLG